MTQASFKRDMSSNAVLSTDIQSLNKYKMERQQYRTVDQLRSEVKSIQETLDHMCERLEKLESK